ncbi:transposase family protein [Streptomyces sp. NPDC093097]|uniref:helix-turn-helix domain-containing protein n=1 Tax=Streptomyces sp. NPDC093097 TaxID=3366027 RepID=UPI003807D563
MLDVPHEVVEHVSRLIHARRCERKSRWRRLGRFRQALLALVQLRKNETLARAAAGFDVSTATAGRYVTETVEILAERAPDLRTVLRTPPTEGFDIRDGTLIPTDHIAAGEPHFSQEHPGSGRPVARAGGRPARTRRPRPRLPHT